MFDCTKESDKTFHTHLNIWRRTRWMHLDKFRLFFFFAWNTIQLQPITEIICIEFYVFSIIKCNWNQLKQSAHYLYIYDISLFHYIAKTWLVDLVHLRQCRCEFVAIRCSHVPNMNAVPHAFHEIKRLSEIDCPLARKKLHGEMISF